MGSDVGTAKPGSSPRVWGQVLCKSEKLNAAGIIPTRVGTREAVATLVKKPQDHPHACGDKACKCRRICQRRGSSPRVWGQVEVTCESRSESGIIPTRVGTRYRGSPAQRGLRDHPHACGDKNQMFSLDIWYQGSSPRVWGQAVCRRPHSLTPWIIPTRVGTRTHLSYSF